MKTNIKTKIGKLIDLKKIWLVGLFILFFGFNTILAPVIEDVTGIDTGLSAVVYAEDTAAGADTTDDANKNKTGPTEIQKKVGEVVAFVVSSTAPIVVGLSNMTGALLDNDWVYGAIGTEDAEKASNKTKMSNILKTMWKIVRDLVNYVFIVILVAVALMNVLSAGSSMHDKFAIKTTLPKIVIALVAVNFTWFGAKLILDAANVATHIVFAIPQTASEAIGATSGSTYCLVEEVELIENGTVVKVPDEAQTGCPTGEYNYGKFKIKWKEDTDILSKLNGGSITKLFAFSFLHIERLSISVDGDGNISNLTINSIFAVIILVLVFIIFAVMVFVLFLRVIFLWLNIILSPIFVLLPILQDFSVPTGGDDAIGIKAFLKQAFIPAAMALPMVIGLTMIIAGQSLNIFTSQAAEVDVDNLTKNINDVNFLQQTMWYILVVAIMWSSVQIAEKSSDIAGTVISTVTAPVKDAAKWLAKSPQYIPFLPVKKDINGDGKEDDNDRISLNNLGEYLPLKMEKLRNDDRARSRAFADVEATPVDALPNAELRKLVGDLKGKGSDVRSGLATAGKAENEAAFWDSLRNNSTLKESAALAKQNKVSPEKYARAVAHASGLAAEAPEVEAIATKFSGSGSGASSGSAAGGTSAPDFSGINFNAQLDPAAVSKVEAAIKAAPDKQKMAIEIVQRASADNQTNLINQLENIGGVDWGAVSSAIANEAAAND